MAFRVAPFGWYLGLATLCAGCLPSSCQRTPSRAISAVDSLSRQIAGNVLPDTLRYEGTLVGPNGQRLEYPRTVRFGDRGNVVVSDAQRNSIFYFDAMGTLERELTWDGASVPYLAGLFGDTTVVFSPGSRRIDFISSGVPVRSIQTPAGIAETALQYVAVTPAAAYIKVTGKDIAPFLALLDGGGRMHSRRPLAGSTWHNAGPLRVWGDSLLSFSGFFPVVDVLSTSLQGPADSLVLKGFDSPMLARTYAFLQGKGRGAPLLASSAAPADRFLFVLNMRPGWLRVDVYDRQGHLRFVLLEPDPGYNKEYYPIDIAVRQFSDTKFRIAVAIIEPEAMVQLYTWSTAADSAQTAYATLDP